MKCRRRERQAQNGPSAASGVVPLFVPGGSDGRTQSVPSGKPVHRRQTMTTSHAARHGVGSQSRSSPELAPIQGCEPRYCLDCPQTRPFAHPCSETGLRQPCGGSGLKCPSAQDAPDRLIALITPKDRVGFRSASSGSSYHQSVSHEWPGETGGRPRARESFGAQLLGALGLDSFLLGPTTLLARRANEPKSASPVGQPPLAQRCLLHGKRTVIWGDQID